VIVVRAVVVEDDSALARHSGEKTGEVNPAGPHQSVRAAEIPLHNEDDCVARLDIKYTVEASSRIGRTVQCNLIAHLAGCLRVMPDSVGASRVKDLPVNKDESHCHVSATSQDYFTRRPFRSIP